MSVHEKREDFTRFPTPVIVERLVDETDTIVRHVRCAEWQAILAGEREVQKALR